VAAEPAASPLAGATPATARGTSQPPLTIERTAYGVNFAAESFSDYLGDKAIDKFFSLNVTLIY